MKSGQTGLFFGSFNPIHNGHLMLANYLVEYSGLDEIWFVVSPQNPLKDKKSLLADHYRLDMVNLAIEHFPKFRSCDIEFRMPRPSFTVDTLTRLSEKHPGRSFTLICGLDSLQSFHKWKNYEAILAQYPLLVYPRKGFATIAYKNHPSVRFTDAPEIEVSSSFIRKGISEGKDLSFFVPEKVYRYMQDMHFYDKLT